MPHTRTIEYIFFFGVLGATAYLLWQIIAPFLGALAIAGVIVTVGYPFYKKVLSYTPRHNKTLASLIATVLIVLLVVAPLALLGYFLFSEALSFYTSLNQGAGALFDQSIARLETVVRYVAPSFRLEASAYAREAAGWVVANIGTIFSETASTVFVIFISVVGIFYFFRDGAACVSYLIHISPLPDAQNKHIIRQLIRSVRSVVLGTLVVALAQCILTGIGFAIFGIANPILWGAIATVGSLIPGIGTFIVFVPTVLFLLFENSMSAAVGIAIWGALAVGTTDNLLRPYLMSRGTALHSFLVLLTVLGGIAVFGPMGFILGPVTLSLFMVLLELHNARSEENTRKPL